MPDKFNPIDLENITLGSDRPLRREASVEIKEKALAEFEKRKNNLIRLAVLKHTQGISYRGLRVGASLLASNPSSEGGFQEESAHNLKPRKHTQHQWDKLCAENNAATAAILDGSDYIAGMVVVSHHKIIGEDAHDATHHEKGLHCCQNCRNLFRELIEQGIMDDKTKMVFVNDGPIVYEDINDTETLKGVIDKPDEVSVLPKLKLNKVVTDADMENLPREEIPLGEFLKGYAHDEPSKSGYTPPPYKLV